MMGKKDLLGRDQVQMVTLERLVPQEHLVRKLDTAVNLDFVYELTQELYSPIGKGSIDPIVLVKITFLQYIFGIRSMRQTIREIETNVAYRWYLGYSLEEEIPHFSTFGKNYTRRFGGTDVFEQIFRRITQEACELGFVQEDSVFIDGTHIKASANMHNSKKEWVEQSARYYEQQLQKEIHEDRIRRGKAACKKKQKSRNGKK